LYFIEKFSPALKTWQREVLHIIQNIAQYFYPQKQTKVMNEGCACFVHFYIVNELYNRGLITEGTMLEIIHMHSNVMAQPDFDDPRFSGINPYTLGFAMMQDIRRVCCEPTDEDREWLPGIAGNEDWRAVLRHAWANYRDESFILQYLSPHLMRKFRMFALADDARKSHYTVEGIHNEAGYSSVRATLAKTYDISSNEPTIQINDVDLLGDRHLHLKHTMHNGIPLDEKNRDGVLKHMRYLWGYDVNLGT
jgi:stage V sporulation protein R